MKKLIALVLSFGIILLSSSHEIYATKGYGRGYRKARENVQNNNAQHVHKQTVENNSNQSQQLADMSDVQVVSDVKVVEALVNSVEKLEIGDHQALAEQQNSQQDSLLMQDSNKLEQNTDIAVVNDAAGQLGEEVALLSELKKSQDQIMIVESSVPHNLQSQFDETEISGTDHGQASSSEVHEDVLPAELGQRVSEDSLAEEMQEIKIEEELIDASDDYVVQDQVNKSFEVSFKDNQEKEVFTHCDSYRFCEFMTHALKRMSEPETVSMVRHYGFGLGHVPLLLVWSSHLFDRLQKSSTYCMETQDLKDILMLILIIDLRAQVDAACIEHMKKSSPSRSALAVQTDSKVIEQATASTPFTADYLKSKLVMLWFNQIQEMYRKKKLPCYSTILQKVKDIAAGWQDDQLQSPIWVCCVKHASFMTLQNIFAAWPSDRFGNWWNPESSLIIACQGCDYSEIRKPKTDEVLADFEKHASWTEYFGDKCFLTGVDDAEYDSDGGF